MSPGRRLGSAFAPAKINLALHVIGRRADGYHELDSLVVFADCGDVLEAFEPRTDEAPALSIDGPFAAELAPSPDNLVLRAHAALAAAGADLPGVHFQLEKRLPVASGIGGGSADAAAALRLLASLCRNAPSPDELAAIAARLGADVPMCLRSAPLRAEGIGERLTLWADAPRLSLVLVNPGVKLSTPAIFRRLARRDHPPIGALPRFADAASLAGWLQAETRNDLEPAALAEAPVIADVAAALATTEGCLLRRMSGSGATFFGLYADDETARRAAERLQAAHPNWWVAATATIPG